MIGVCIAHGDSMFVTLAVLCRRQGDDNMDDLVKSDPLAWFGGICHPSLKESAEIFSAGEMM